MLLGHTLILLRLTNQYPKRLGNHVNRHRCRRPEFAVQVDRQAWRIGLHVNRRSLQEDVSGTGERRPEPEQGQGAEDLQAATTTQRIHSQQPVFETAIARNQYATAEEAAVGHDDLMDDPVGASSR